MSNDSKNWWSRRISLWWTFPVVLLLSTILAIGGLSHQSGSNSCKVWIEIAYCLLMFLLWCTVSFKMLRTTRDPSAGPDADFRKEVRVPRTTLLTRRGKCTGRRPSGAPIKTEEE